MLTDAKRAEMRARTEGSARLIEESKKTNMMIIQDQDEMLAAAEAIPMPARRSPAVDATLGSGSGGGGGGGGGGGAAGQRGDRKRPRSPAVVGAGDEGGEEGGESGRGLRGQRDPMTAWFYGCYSHDEYTGHVADLRKFLCGIEFHHVSFFFFFCCLLFNVVYRTDGRTDAHA